MVMTADWTCSQGAAETENGLWTARTVRTCGVTWFVSVDDDDEE